MPYLSVPPRLAAASGRMGDGVSWASPLPRSTAGPRATAPVTPAARRKVRRLRVVGRWPESVWSLMEDTPVGLARASSRGVRSLRLGQVDSERAIHSLGDPGPRES